MEPFKKYLQQFPNYTPNIFENVLPFLSEKTINAGEILLRQGKTAKDIAFIEYGLFRQYYINEDGKEITSCFCKENSITTSYRSLITQQESEISIQAVEESKLIIVSLESIKKLLNTDLFWQQFGRLAAENEFIISESHNRFLKDLSATDRYLQIFNNDKELLQRVPLKFLASYLQISPETLSRVRNKISRT